MLRESFGFLERVRERPEDDAPRLITADWFDDIGEHDRAEFIRLQLAIAKLEYGTAPRTQLKKREEQLLFVHRQEWAAPFKEYATAVEFRRGFIEEVTLPARTFLKQWPNISALAPIRNVNLLDVGDDPRAVMHSPYLQQLHGLRVESQYLADTLAEAIADSQQLGNIQRLQLDSNTITDVGVALITNCPSLQNLRHLNLAKNRVTTVGISRIANASHWKHLDTLDLCENPLGVAGIQNLAKSALCERLKRLALVNTFPLEPAESFTRDVARLASIPEIYLPLNMFNEVHVDRFFNNERYTRMYALDASKNRLGNGGIQRLAQAPAMQNVRWLKLVSNEIEDAGLRAIAASTVIGKSRIPEDFPKPDQRCRHSSNIGFDYSNEITEPHHSGSRHLREVATSDSTTLSE